MIFDTTNLDNQIIALQQERDHKTTLNIAATQLLSGLADLIDGLDESAIAILKAEILDLFDGKLESLTGQDLEAPTTEAVVSWDEPESLTLRHCSDHCSDVGETISDRVIQAKQEYYQLTQTANPAIAYLRRGDGQIGHIYIGGMSQVRLQAWADWAYQNGYVQTQQKGVGVTCNGTPRVREAERMTNWQYELKLRPMPINYLRELIEMDYTRYPSPSSLVPAA